MGLEAILGIITSIIAIVSAVLGVNWKKAKNVARSVVDTADKVIEAAEDDKITKEEAKGIATQAKDILKTHRRKVGK